MSTRKPPNSNRRYRLAATYGLTSSLLVTVIAAAGDTESPMVEFPVPSALPFVGTRSVAILPAGARTISASPCAASSSPATFGPTPVSIPASVWTTSPYPTDSTPV